MSLYQLRIDNAAEVYGQKQYIIKKFDNDFNCEATYLVSETACSCPAGLRSSCRHRNMLSRMIPNANKGWFYAYETQKWHRPLGEPEVIYHEPHGSANAEGASSPSEPIDAYGRSPGLDALRLVDEPTLPAPATSNIRRRV